MDDWFKTMDDRFWLMPDRVGQDEAAFIERALTLQKGHHVLDAPCGAGRILFHLANAGYSLTGLDLRSSFIERARARLDRAGLQASLFVMDIREMSFSDRFHGIYNWGGSFGYFPDKDNKEILRRYAGALRRGGRLLVHQVNREYVLRHFRAERELEGYTRHNSWDRRTQRIISERTADGITEARNRSSMRLYTPGQMRSLLEEAGLVVDRMYGSIQSDNYRKSSEWMIVVGRKD